MFVIYSRQIESILLLLPVAQGHNQPFPPSLLNVDTQTLFAFLRIQKGIKNLDYNSDFAEALFTQRVIACSLDRISNDFPSPSQ